MPTLYVVPTPIGNLEDITLRALRVLSEVTVVFAEDTRHTRALLRHYQITTPLQSYHQHNKRAALDPLLAALEQGDVGLVSSAGMPSISDPGFEAIAAVRQRDMPVDVLPGASAVVTAVVGAAIPAPGFVFAGFAPRNAGERRAWFTALAELRFAIVLYEAPHRLRAALTDIVAALGNRRMVAARELTKMHQEYIAGSVEDLIARFDHEEPRGEFTLVIAGSDRERQIDPTEVEAAIQVFRDEGLDGRTAVRRLAARFDLPRNEAYRIWLDATAEHQA